MTTAIAANAANAANDTPTLVKTKVLIIGDKCIDFSMKDRNLVKLLYLKDR